LSIPEERSPDEGRSEERGASAEAENDDFIETDRNSFTFARQTPGANRLIVESSYSFLDLSGEKIKNSFPELLLRYGIGERFELRLRECRKLRTVRARVQQRVDAQVRIDRQVTAAEEPSSEGKRLSCLAQRSGKARKIAVVRAEPCVHRRCCALLCKIADGISSGLARARDIHLMADGEKCDDRCAGARHRTRGLGGCERLGDDVPAS
jgi:hypothetical protein